MMSVFDIVLLVVYIVLMPPMALLIVFGIYDYIKGTSDAEKLLKKLRIPLSYKQILIITFVCAVLMTVIYLLMYDRGLL